MLQHWRHYKFNGMRPFFCQVEAAEVAIWLSEVAPKIKAGKKFLDYLKNANEDANPGLQRLALKLATGAGKTTVMSMLIAWQTINAVRQPGSKKFTRGFLVVAPGLTIKDRLRVLQPNDPGSYYQNREIVPDDMLADLKRAKIVITRPLHGHIVEFLSSSNGLFLIKMPKKHSISRICWPITPSFHLFPFFRRNLPAEAINPA